MIIKDKIRGRIGSWYLRLYWRLRYIGTKLHLCKPLKWSWYELPSVMYFNIKAVRVLDRTNKGE